MISASHNPWYDNGIKFFAPGGSKLGDRVQDEIQARFARCGNRDRGDSDGRGRP